MVSAGSATQLAVLVLLELELLELELLELELELLELLDELELLEALLELSPPPPQATSAAAAPPDISHPSIWRRSRRRCSRSCRAIMARSCSNPR